MPNLTVDLELFFFNSTDFLGRRAGELAIFCRFPNGLIFDPFLKLDIYVQNLLYKSSWNLLSKLEFIPSSFNQEMKNFGVILTRDSIGEITKGSYSKPVIPPKGAIARVDLPPDVVFHHASVF